MVILSSRMLLSKAFRNSNFRRLLSQAPQIETSTAPIIDAWAQPCEASFRPLIPEIERLFKMSKSKHTDLSIQEHVNEMDKANVQKVLLCAWNRPGKVVISNERVAEYVEKFPNRFAGVCSVNLANPVEACATIDKWVGSQGFKAVRIVQWLWNKPPTDKLFYPIYVKCCEHKVPICLQVGHTGPLCPSETGRPIPYIDEVALTFPDLDIVCGHIGYPWTEEMCAVAWKHQNVYIDTSAYAPKYYPKELLRFLTTTGRHKVMFGTNFPQLDWQTCGEQARNLPLPKEVLEAFLYGTAQRVFKL